MSRKLKKLQLLVLGGARCGLHIHLGTGTVKSPPRPTSHIKAISKLMAQFDLQTIR